jgi:hypothetical protein
MNERKWVSGPGIGELYERLVAYAVGLVDYGAYYKAVKAVIAEMSAGVKEIRDVEDVKTWFRRWFGVEVELK